MFGSNHLFDVFFDFSTRQHDFVPTSSTTNAKVHTDTQHGKSIGAARVGLFRLDGIANVDVHSTRSFLCVKIYMRKNKNAYILIIAQDGIG